MFFDAFTRTSIVHALSFPSCLGALGNVTIQTVVLGHLADPWLTSILFPNACKFIHVLCSAMEWYL